MTNRKITAGELPDKKALTLDKELEKLIEECQIRLDEHEEGHKAGDVWRQDKPKYHLEKAMGELGMAGYHARQEESGKEDLLRECADAVNHILFALALAEQKS